MTDVLPSLEAVYYSSPIPLQRRSLSLLALVFDRLHFPGVYMPSDDYDLDLIEVEARRIEAFKFNDYGTAVLVASLRAVKHLPHLREFCNFDATAGSFGTKVEPSVPPLVNILDEVLFGPRPNNFIPTHSPWSSKGLPGGEACINYPGDLYYPAGALVYARKRGIPLVDDTGLIPSPLWGANDVRGDATALTTLLAMKCIDVALPSIRLMSPEEMVEMRHELASFIKPFRAAVLVMSGRLNQELSEDDDASRVDEAARFVAETTVIPALADLQSALDRPARDWLDRAPVFAAGVPALGVAYGAAGIPGVTAAALATIAVELAQTRRAQKTAATSPFLYLHRAKQIVDKR